VEHTQPIEKSAGGSRRDRRLLTLAPIIVWALFSAQAGTREVLYVQNTFSGDITLIGIPSHEVIGRIDIGKFPDDVVASPDGRTVYVNRINGAGLERTPNFGDSGEVIAISPTTNQVLWRVSVDGAPHHMTLTRDSKILFVPLFNSVWVAVIDTERRAVVDKIAVGYGSHGTRLSPDGKRLYVGSLMNDHVSIIDVESRKIMRQIPMEDGVRPFDITADEKWMYAQRSRLHGFDVIDLAAGKVVKTVALPALPDGTKTPVFFPHTFNHGLALTRDGKMLFAAGSVADYVCVYSVPDLKRLATIPVGRDPNWIVFSSDGSFAYVTNRGSNDLSVISVSDFKEVKRVKVGNYPQRLQVLKVT
jgi:YVTN family beta-propeller protein